MEPPKWDLKVGTPPDGPPKLRPPTEDPPTPPPYTPHLLGSLIFLRFSSAFSSAIPTWQPSASSVLWGTTPWGSRRGCADPKPPPRTPPLGFGVPSLERLPRHLQVVVALRFGEAVEIQQAGMELLRIVPDLRLGSGWGAVGSELVYGAVCVGCVGWGHSRGRRSIPARCGSAPTAHGCSPPASRGCAPGGGAERSVGGGAAPYGTWGTPQRTPRPTAPRMLRPQSHPHGSPQTPLPP